MYNGKRGSLELHKCVYTASVKFQALDAVKRDCLLVTVVNGMKRSMNLNSGFRVLMIGQVKPQRQS